MFAATESLFSTWIRTFTEELCPKPASTVTHYRSSSWFS